HRHQSGFSSFPSRLPGDRDGGSAVSAARRTRECWSVGERERVRGGSPPADREKKGRTRKLDGSGRCRSGERFLGATRSATPHSNWRQTTRQCRGGSDRRGKVVSVAGPYPAER